MMVCVREGVQLTRMEQVVMVMGGQAAVNGRQPADRARAAHRQPRLGRRDSSKGAM